MAWILSAYLVMCSTFYLPFLGNERISQEIIYMFFGCLIGCIYFMLPKKRNYKLNRFTVWFGIFVIYNAVQFILVKCEIGSNVLFNMVWAFLIYNATLSVKKEQTHIFINTILWVCIFNIVMMILQTTGYDFLYSVKGPKGTIVQDSRLMVGSLCSQFALSIYFAVGACATFYYNRFIPYLFAIPLYLSVTTGAILAYLCGIFNYYWWISRRIIYIFVPVMIILAGLYVWKVDAPMGYMDTRPMMWKRVMDDIFHLKVPEITGPYLGNPILGFGIDSFRMGNIKYLLDFKTKKTVPVIVMPNGIKDLQGKDYKMEMKSWGMEITNPEGNKCDWWDNPHNSIIEVLFCYGLIGLFIVFMCGYNLIQIFTKSYKTKELVVITSMLIVLLVSSLSHFPASLARLGSLFPVLFGLFMLNASHLEDDNA